MIIDFNNTNEITVKSLNGGTGSVISKMHIDDDGKVMISRIPVGSSIGMHTQKTSDDINLVISGEGLAICNGVEEKLCAGVCHICKKGSTHSIINTGESELVLFTVVAEKAQL